MNIDELRKRIANSGFIMLNKQLASSIGINEAILYCELVSQRKRFEGRLDKGYFYCTVETIEEATSLSKYQQTEAIKKLIEYGLIKYIPKRGAPPRRHFRIILNDEIINQYLPIRNEENTQKQHVGEQIAAASEAETIIPEFTVTSEDNKEEVDRTTIIQSVIDKYADFAKNQGVSIVQVELFVVNELAQKLGISKEQAKTEYNFYQAEQNLF